MIYCAREAHGLTPRLYCYVHQCYVCEEYQAGEYAANYPVPSRLGTVNLDNAYDCGCIYIEHADAMWERCPVITWWSEAFDMTLPIEHGIADYIGN